MKKDRKSKNPAIIPDNIDFSRVFSTENQEEESFEELFNATSRDSSLKKLMNEKKKVSSSAQTMSKSSLLKTYPNPQETLDLHGLIEEQAMEEAIAFINRETQRKTRTVRIITGKGLHSEHGPVLRNSIELLAIQLTRNDTILSWKWEKKVKEKSGSVIFYLK